MRIFAILQEYPWPGNIRELYNALYRACSLCQNNLLRIEDLGLAPETPHSRDIDQFITEGDTLDEMVGRFEAAVLNKFYAKYPSSRKLATRLGVSHTAIANKLRQYGIGNLSFRRLNWVKWRYCVKRFTNFSHFCLFKANA